MKAWLMDAYRKEDKIILWLKTQDDDLRREFNFKTCTYVDEEASHIFDKENIAYTKETKKTYLRKDKKVLRIDISRVGDFEKVVRKIEEITSYRIPMYNADITPEQMFLYKKDLRPCCAVEIIGNKIRHLKDHPEIALKTLRLSIVFEKNHEQTIIKNIIFDDNNIICETNNTDIVNEKIILELFAKKFENIDPDVIIMDRAYKTMPILYERLKHHSITCRINRWDDREIKYKGGRSFWTYGQVRHQDYAIRLRGRFLVDTNSFVGSECDPEGIAELAELSGTLYQVVASRSFGSAFQFALVREMITQDILVPFKEKPIEPPLSMLQMLKADRAGHTFDPVIGFHTDIAEIDFSSMYPWIIYNHNISADTIICDDTPKYSVPGIPISIHHCRQGLVPRAVRPFIERRMYYKKNPSTLNNKRSKALKWVLVSCYGYLRFREFKLGIPSAHMAICAHARKILLETIDHAQNRGFEVVHGIVDSVYLKKENITEDEVRDFCNEIYLSTGIPIDIEGIFKWIVFLPSVIDKDRPLPATYYGVMVRRDENKSHENINFDADTPPEDKECVVAIKARGVSLRQRSSPFLIRRFQEETIRYLGQFDTEDEIRKSFPVICKALKDIIRDIDSVDKECLVIPLRVSKTDYKYLIPQKIVLDKLRSRGISIMPGQFIRFIHSDKGIILPEDYVKDSGSRPDISVYKKLLVKSIFMIMQPFGFTKKDVYDGVSDERQTKIYEWQKNSVSYREKISDRVLSSDIKLVLCRP